MKKLSFASIGILALAAALRPAAAADLQPYYGAPPPVIIFSWTGFYFGAHVGGGWASKDFGNQTFAFGGVTYTPASATVDPTGWLAGGQIGANYQAGSWVFGIEVDASWADLSGSANCSSASAAVTLTANCTANVDALGTIAGRLGVAFDRVLVYAKGGAAWANDKYALNSSVLNFNANETRWGWMLGAGVEYSFTDSWSAKIEYDYLDFSNRSVRFTDTTDQINLDSNIRQRIQLVKTGINYRFGWAPVGVRY
jgi:outer membrane immunogenic protein